VKLFSSSRRLNHPTVDAIAIERFLSSEPASRRFSPAIDSQHQPAQHSPATGIDFRPTRAAPSISRGKGLAAPPRKNRRLASGENRVSAKRQSWRWGLARARASIPITYLAVADIERLISRKIDPIARSAGASARAERSGKRPLPRPSVPRRSEFNDGRGRSATNRVLGLRESQTIHRRRRLRAWPARGTIPSFLITF